MMQRRSQLSRRQGGGGANGVEFALVAPVVFLLLFGILEWSRYLWTINMAQNAAREGARYAIVRTDTDQTNTTVANITTVVTNYLNNAGNGIQNLNIYVYKTNLAGQPIDLSTPPNILTTSQAQASSNETNWNQTPFGSVICVTLSGTYTPLLPGLTQMGVSLPVSATSIMNSEGN